ncbi:probable GH family 25 lysozyme 3 [Mytilus edulis]|uniref:probable GH family 25 lysozyme 3 n=1 Tax=Mytilus edulis TaxID=6550 RepID=UPI0039EF5F71
MMIFQTFFFLMALSTITVAVYAPTEKHALDRHGVEKVLLVENIVGRNINGRRGGGSLSVLDVIDANRRTGSRAGGTSHGIGNEFLSHGSSASIGLSGGSVGGRVSVSRGSQAGFSRALSDDDSISNCHYGCGDDKLCRSGHKCVHDGCSSYCVDISSRSSSSGLTSVSSNDGHISSGSRIGTSGLARNFDLSRSSRLETIDSGRGVSGHSGSDILDAISSGRVGLDNVDSRRSGSGRTSGSGVVFQSVLGGKTDCKKDCFSDGDCPTSKYCATVNCHMICRRRPSKGYTG